MSTTEIGQTTITMNNNLPVIDQNTNIPIRNLPVKLEAYTDADVFNARSLRDRRFELPLMSAQERDFLLGRMSRTQEDEYLAPILMNHSNVDLMAVRDQIKTLDGKMNCLNKTQFWLKVAMIVMSLAGSILFIFAWYVAVPIVAVGVGCWIASMILDSKAGGVAEEGKKLESDTNLKLNAIRANIREVLTIQYYMQNRLEVPALLAERQIIQHIDYPEVVAAKNSGNGQNTEDTTITEITDENENTDEKTKSYNSRLGFRALDLDISNLSYATILNDQTKLPLNKPDFDSVPESKREAFKAKFRQHLETLRYNQPAESTNEETSAPPSTEQINQ